MPLHVSSTCVHRQEVKIVLKRANLSPRRRVLEYLTVSRLVKKLSTWYGTQKRTAVFRTAHHYILSYARRIQSTPSHHIFKIHFNTILLSSPQKGTFYPAFPRILWAYHRTYACYIPSNLIIGLHILYLSSFNDTSNSSDYVVLYDEVNGV